MQRTLHDMSHVPRSSLLRSYGNVYSQAGQDGILSEIFRRLGVATGFFVEFGGWDGVHLSNCRWLFENGWGGCYIEADSEKFLKLVENYKADLNVFCINSFVDCQPGIFFDNMYKYSENNLRSLLVDNVPSIDVDSIDLVNIDIDGLDLEVACSIGFKPKVLLIEGGSNLSPKIMKPFHFASRNNQHPLGFIVKVIRSLGYQPVCFLQDLYAVREDLVDNVLPEARKFSAVELYQEHFWFRGAAFREYLRRLRSMDPGIQQFEREVLGFFDPSPVTYGLTHS
jgi:hypothetical protein